MISEKIENILNEQINKEFYSAYLYLLMGAYFDEIGLKAYFDSDNRDAEKGQEHKGRREPIVNELLRINHGNCIAKDER